jgi:adenylate cyclase
VGGDPWVRDDLGVRIRVIAANLGGSVLVVTQAVVIGWPAGTTGPHFRRNTVISTLVMVGYLLVVIPIADRIARRRADRVFGWIDAHRLPSEGEAAAVLDFPWVQAREFFWWWLGGALVFGMLNVIFGNSIAYCLRTALSVAMGGLTTSALTFLLLERLNRPTFIIALAGEPATTGRRIGIRRRLVLIWALGAAVPVIIMMSAPAGLSSMQRTHLAERLVIVGVLGLVVGLVLTVAAARSVTEPLDALRSSQRRVAEGDLDVEVPVDDGGEVGMLQSGFNRMIAGLRERQRLHDLFGRHVGVEVARHALAQGARLGGERRTASVLFIDLIGSTSLAQQLPPEEMVAMLNEFFSLVVNCAGAEGGWVNKFEGDAALCVFGPPAGDDGHARHALRAARSLQAAVRDLVVRHPGLDAGIGVSTGEVVAGNVGAEDRFEYTVIGDPVNEAARLSEQAKTAAGRVLASGRSTDGAAEERDCWAEQGVVTLRGRSEPTLVFAPTERALGSDP